MNKEKIKCSLLLFLAALIWGTSFVTQSKGMDYMGPFTFNGARSVMAAVVLFPLAMMRRKKSMAKGSTEAGSVAKEKSLLIGGICCGLALAAASTFQQFGIQYTTVGKAGFITTLYIIFVPILGIFIGRKAPKIVWIGAMLAAVGMYLLCMQESLHLGKGDALVFICALLFSIHILVIDHFSPGVDGVMLSCIQFTVCGVLCMICAFIFEHPTWGQLMGGILPLIYSGVFSGGIGYTLQILGQKGLNPTVAALLCSLESVVSALAGYGAYRIGFLQEDQTLSGRQILGCGLVFLAVILVQLPMDKIIKKRNTSR